MCRDDEHFHRSSGWTERQLASGHAQSAPGQRSGRFAADHDDLGVLEAWFARHQCRFRLRVAAKNRRMFQPHKSAGTLSAAPSCLHLPQRQPAHQRTHRWQQMHTPTGAVEIAIDFGA